MDAAPDCPLLVPVCLRRDYRIRYEHAAGHIFVHVEVGRWTSQVRRAFLRDVSILHELLGQPVYALSDPGDSHHHKFLASCGFHPAGHARTSAGRPNLVFERTLDGQHVRRWFDDHQQQQQQ